jgi:uncharacterized membrane protein
MSKGRLEAFSDGVIAIVLTIMVLELKEPAGAALADLGPSVPTLLAYLLSFVYVGIYWTNHHHMLHAAQRVDGRILWANLHLLFWLSLVPFTTQWVGEHPSAPVPVALYGGVLLAAGCAYFVLARTLARQHGPGSEIATALGRDVKGKASIALYAAAIPLAFASVWIAHAMYVGVAAMWLVPDRRFEKR